MERKVELHCHCDGVVDPAMLREFARRGEALEATAKELEAAYPVTSLERWSGLYETALRGFWCPATARMSLVACAQRERWREQNVRYAELFVSRILGAVPEGEPLREWFRALGADLRLPAAYPEVNLLVCLSRQKVAQHVERIVDLAEAGLIAGVALAGDELACPIRDLRAPLERIRKTGIGIEIHAGEVGGPESVRDALDHGRPQRIGHGIRAFEDVALVERIARENVHLEFCPTSNLRLGVIPNIQSLPVALALSAGVAFSVNTDDPGVFQCSLTSELMLVQEAFELSESDMDRISLNSLGAGFREQAALKG
jgi:adenosine deaminase